MKRKLIILLSLLSIVSLTACFSSEETLPNETLVPKPDEDLTPDIEDDLELPNDEDPTYNTALFVIEVLESIELEESVDGNFELIQNLNGVDLSWESTDSAIIIEDDLAIVKQTVVDKEVTLLAVAQYEEVVRSKVFKVVVEEIYMGTPETYTALEVMDYVSLRIENESYYLKEQTGYSNGVTWAGTVVQSVSNKTYKLKDDYFLETVSLTTQTILGVKSPVYHNAYFDGYNVSYNHSSDEISNTSTPNVTSEQSYKEVFGVAPTDGNFTGYIINESTIDEWSYSKEESLHVFNYNLNATTSTKNISIQMIKYGGLSNFEYISVNLTMVLDDDWNIQYIDTFDEYKGRNTINVSLEQKLRTTFTKFDISNPSITLPDYSRYKTAIN